MLVLGMLLVGATAAFVALAIVENFSGGPGYSVTLFGQHVATLNALETFLAGLALALVFCFGLAMMTGGALWMRVRRRRRRARRAARERDMTTARDTQGEPPAAEAGATTGKPRHRHGLHIFGH
ncbi:hypothetical protein [Streptomyces sp. RPT161]|uniref:hypothetical protein n=1 Tax=Streptomyces sp. RPT161 TaxID=3015993 RepID=UPI0022B85979|nr:hypothetical protein [Streptomyces sp. RPT161]